MDIRRLGLRSFLLVAVGVLIAIIVHRWHPAVSQIVHADVGWN